MSNDYDDLNEQTTKIDTSSTAYTSSSSSSISSIDSISTESDLELIIELTAALNLNPDIFKHEDLIHTQNEQVYLNKENILNHLKSYLNNHHEPISESDEIRLNELKTALVLEDDKTNYLKSLFDLNHLPTSLLVKNLRGDVFTNEEIKLQFEYLFEGLACKFCYLPSFRRCYIQFENPIASLIARIQLHNRIFLNEPLNLLLIRPIKMKNTRQFLEAPQVDKLFLISPPSSPPVGWEQEFEDPPVLNLDLLAALSKLEPHEPCELVQSKDNLPSIVVHPCPDIDMVSEPQLKRKFIPTRRPDDFY